MRIESPYFLLVVAVAVVAVMRARFMGDTIDYAGALSVHPWDFGHLVWRPVAWLARTYGELDTAGVIRVLLVFNAIAYIGTALLMRATLNLVTVDRWASTIAVIGFLFSQAVLNYGVAGSSYGPGLTLTVLALYLALLPPATAVRAWLLAFGSGAAMAAAICFWFPYVLVVPGVLLAPLILRGPRNAGIAFLLRGGVALGVIVLAAFGSAAYLTGVRDVAGLYAWTAGTSGGIRTSGVARMIFGLARSFIYMGDDGLLYKRYLLNDPYNPVTLTDLLGLSVWKLVSFYLVLAGVALQLLRDAARRRLALVALIGGLPVVMFGVFWQGGDMERYLPLYPFFFLALAGAWDAPRRWPGLRTLLVLFCTVLVVVNGYSHSPWQVGLVQNDLTDRVRDLQADLKPRSVIIVIADRLVLLPRDFPLETAGAGLDIEDIVTRGSTTSGEWQSDFAALALSTWEDGGDVWLSRRVFAATPSRDSTWAEGDDASLKWAEFPAFFSTWEVDGNADDSFVRLRNTKAQHERLQEMMTIPATDDELVRKPSGDADCTRFSYDRSAACHGARMTRIIGLSGSLRRGSFNAHLLRAAQVLVPAGTLLTIESITDIPLYNFDDETAHGLPAAVVALKDSLAGADGLLISTPEYNNSLPGVLKNTIDWLSPPPADIARVFGGLPVAIVGASPGAFGTVLAQTAWLPVLRALGANQWNGGRLLVPGAGRVFDAGGGLTDDAVRQRLETFVHGFVEFVGQTRRRV